MGQVFKPELRPRGVPAVVPTDFHAEHGPNKLSRWPGIPQHAPHLKGCC